MQPCLAATLRSTRYCEEPTVVCISHCLILAAVDRGDSDILIKRCPGVGVESPGPVDLQQGRYYRLDPRAPWISTALIWQNVGGRPTPAIVPWETNRRRVFYVVVAMHSQLFFLLNQRNTSLSENVVPAFKFCV